MKRTKWVVFLGTALLAGLLPLGAFAQGTQPAPKREPVRIQQTTPSRTPGGPVVQQRRRRQNDPDRERHNPRRRKQQAGN